MSINKTKLETLLTLINSAARVAIAEYDKVGEDVPSIDSTRPHPLDDAIDQVELKKAVRTLEGACAQLCTTLAPPSHSAIKLVQAYDYACVRVVLRENITDILVNHPNGIHVHELSKIVEIEPKKLARVLRLLATRGFYNEVEPDTFANNRLSLMFHSEKPVRHTIAGDIDIVMKGANVLYETLKGSESAYSEAPEHAPIMYADIMKDVTGTFFDWIRQEDARVESYHLSMRGFSNIMGSSAVLTRFPFEKYSTVVDVGGSIGSFSLPLARIHKHIKIIVQDLPEALAQSRNIWARDCPEAIKENRVEFSELNFFTQAPVKGKDIYYLRNIIHDWPDKESIVILRNIRQVLGKNSRVLIHDYVLHELSRKQPISRAASVQTAMAPEPLLPNFGVGNIRMYQEDLTMYIIHNAKERTLQNFLELSAAADLKLEKVWDLAESCALEFSAV